MDREFVELSQDIPASMPILDRYVELHKREQPLAGVTALFIQHQFGNQVPQTRAMLQLGLDPKRLFWLDIPYTSNPVVRRALLELGIPHENLIVADDYWVLDPYAPYQRRRVQRLVHRMLEDPPERLLVLDDGAYFLEAASCFGARLPNVCVVEQTSRGLFKLSSSAAMQKYARSLPIVDVARSEPKKTLEPPFIGIAVCSALQQRLAGRFRAGPKSRCLILGYGAIGSHVARWVPEGLGLERSRVHIFDTDQSRVSSAQQHGYVPWDKGDFGTTFALVIGCSGHASFTVADHVYLKDGAFLASASSGSVELSREEFIELADSSRIDDIEVLRSGLVESNVHSDLEFRLVDKKVTFLNGGFPVNFLGQVNCVPARYMQPTATMMVAGSLCAIATSQKGVLPLDTQFCEWIDAEFRAELGPRAAKFLD